MKDWRGWIVRILAVSGIVEHLFCDDEAEAKAMVKKCRASGEDACYWEL